MRRFFTLMLFAGAAGADIGLYDPLFRPGASVDYCIIASSDPGIVSQAQRLAQWKQEQGLRARVVTVDSIKANVAGFDLQDKIRNCIKTARNAWGAQWVCIAGDYALVPPRILKADSGDTFTIESDFYYACLDGDWDADKNGIFGDGPVDRATYTVIGRYDSLGNYVCDSVVMVKPPAFELIPDVYIGRLPAANGEQMRIIIDKIIAYRSTPHTMPYQAGGLFLSHRLFTRIGEIADGTYYSEQIASIFHGPNSMFNSVVMDRLYEDNVTVQGAIIPDTIRRTTEEYHAYFSRGYNIVLWYGHGCPEHIEISGIEPKQYYHTSEANALNSATFSNIIAEACYALKTQDSFNIAKSFLFNPEGGAVSFTGPTTVDYLISQQPTIKCAFTLLGHRGVRQISRAFALAQIDAQRTAQNWTIPRVSVYGLQYWGDPELELWSQQVAASDTFRIEPQKKAGRLHISLIPPRDSVLVCAFVPGIFFSRGYARNGVVDLDSLPAGIKGVKISAYLRNFLPSSVTVDESGVAIRFARPVLAESTGSIRFSKGNLLIMPGAPVVKSGAIVEIFDLTGRRVFLHTGSCENQIVPLRLPAGTYLVRAKIGPHLTAGSISVIW